MRTLEQKFAKMREAEKKTCKFQTPYDKKIAKLTHLSKCLFDKMMTEHVEEVKEIMHLLKKLQLLPYGLNIEQILTQNINLKKTHTKKNKDNKK